MAVGALGVGAAMTQLPESDVDLALYGWLALLGYGVLGILWCIAKLVFWQETEALVFGVSNVVALLLLAAPQTRRHVRPSR